VRRLRRRPSSDAKPASSSPGVRVPPRPKDAVVQLQPVSLAGFGLVLPPIPLAADPPVDDGKPLLLVAPPEAEFGLPPVAAPPEVPTPPVVRPP
jgi:hypothetical protein